MSGPTYPRIAASRKYQLKRNPPKCCACDERATHRVDIAVTWMRGDDVVVNACDTHRSDMRVMLESPAAVKQLES